MLVPESFLLLWGEQSEVLIIELTRMVAFDFHAILQSNSRAVPGLSESRDAEFQHELILTRFCTRNVVELFLAAPQQPPVISN